MRKTILKFNYISWIKLLLTIFEIDMLNWSKKKYYFFIFFNLLRCVFYGIETKEIFLKILYSKKQFERKYVVMMQFIMCIFKIELWKLYLLWLYKMFNS
jgi:hypothetical protein